MNERSLRVGICSSYAPRACGLATFAADLESALLGAEGISNVSMIRMMNREDRENRSDSESLTLSSRSTSILVDIAEEEPESYILAAAQATANCDVVIVEHEFGIFGGNDGEMIINFLEALRVPIVVTLHTVLPSFSSTQ